MDFRRVGTAHGFASSNIGVCRGSVRGFVSKQSIGQHQMGDRDVAAIAAWIESDLDLRVRWPSGQ